MENKRLCVAYPNESNYSETFIRAQLKYLNPQAAIHHSWFPYIDQHGKNILSFPFSFLLFRGILKRISLPLFKKLYTLDLIRFLKKEKIDIVFAEYGPTGCSVLNACKYLGIPLVPHFHGFDASDFATLEKYKNEYTELFLFSKNIIVVSEVMKNMLIGLGAKKEKIVNNPCSINVKNISPAHPENNAPVFIFIGRFTEKKRPDLTIKAFFEVWKINKAVQLIMAGDGPMLDRCIKLTEDLGIQESVDFKGVVKHNQIYEYLKKARAFVQHSVRAKSGDMEGTPNTILEASAMGLPIVSTKHSGIMEAVIHDKTGYLVDEKDYKKMAYYMTLLADDSKLAGELGKNARKHMAENYSYEYRMNRLKEIIFSA